jgi:hypothetical protein
MPDVLYRISLVYEALVEDAHATPQLQFLKNFYPFCFDL